MQTNILVKSVEGLSMGGSRTRSAAIAAACLLVSASLTTAAPFTFDADTGAALAQDGGGTWTNAGVNWYDGATSSNVAWSTAAGSTATFGAGVDGLAGAYVVTVGESMPAATISFLNSGYTLSAASAFTLGGGSGGGTLSVASGKTATIGQNVTYAKGGNISITGGGTLNIAGTGATVKTGASFQAVTVQANTTADVQTGGAMSTAHQNNASMTILGTLKVTGGTVQVRNDHTDGTIGAASLLIGSGSGNTGTLTLTTGAVEIYRNSLVTGTVANRVSGSFVVGNTAGTGIANLNGGTLIVPNTRLAAPSGTDKSTNGAIIAANGNSAKGTLNFNGTSASVGDSSVRGLRFFNVDAQTNSTGTVNLTAGTVTVPVVTSYSTEGSGTSGTFNFDGGTLRSNVANAAYFGAANTNLLSVTAYVQDGGAKIDSNTFDIGIGQALLHDPALGAAPDGGLTKSGSGVLTLSGASTYTGATTVTGGTLLLNATGSVASTLLDVQAGTFDASAAASLPTFTSVKGAGTINPGSNTVALAAGGTLAPGNSPGVLTIGGSLDVSAVTDTGGLTFELGAPTSDSVLLTSGTLNIGTLNFADFSFTQDAGFDEGTYLLFDTGALISGSIGIASGAIPGALPGAIGTLAFADGGNDVVLTVAVPEPASMAILAMGVLAIGRRRR